MQATTRTKFIRNIIAVLFASLLVSVSLVYKAFSENSAEVYQHLSTVHQRFLEQTTKQFQAPFNRALEDSQLIQGLFRRQGYDLTSLTAQLSAFMDGYIEAYSQVRILNLNGHEAVRINRVNGAPKVVPTDRLQDKSHRPYFLNARNLGTDQHFISPINLNVENNQIVEPYEPVARVVSPLVTTTGQIVAYLVLNLDMNFFGRPSQDELRVLVADLNGNFLIAPDPAANWQNVLTDTTLSAKNFIRGNVQVDTLLAHTIDDGLVSRVRIPVVSTPQLFPDVTGEISYDLYAYSSKQSVSPVFNASRQQSMQYAVILFLCVFMLDFLLIMLIRRKLEQQESQERHNKETKNILSSLPDPVIVSDDNGIITYINESAEILFEYQANEMLGQKTEMFLPSDLISSYISLSDKTLLSDDDESYLNNQAFEATTKSGQVVPVEIKLSTINQQNKMHIALLRDMTVHEQVRHEIEKARQEADKNSHARAAFLANMSHEIRTPMNGIMGMLELLNDTLLDDTQKRYVSQSYSSAEALLRIINDVLDISKIDSGKLEILPEEIDLEEIIVDVGRTLEPLAFQKGIQLYCPVGLTGPVNAIGDPVRLRQVFMNLVSNAIKFTDEGSVEVRVSPLLGNDNNLLSFSVVDTGVGMTAEQLETIFDPFTQADLTSTRRASGTGLGLSIVKSLVSMMDGHIAIDSSPGKGTEVSFSVRLDCNPQPPQDCSGFMGAQLDICVDDLRQFEIIKAICDSWQLTAQAGMHEAEIDKTVLLVDTQSASFGEMFSNSHYPSYAGVIVLHSSAEQIEIEEEVSYLVKPVSPSSLFDAIHHILYDREIPNRDTNHNRTFSQSLLGIKVLLVEDDSVNQQVAEGLLQKMGAKVVIANNGREAISFLRSTNYDVVLMDCQMPELDGYSATKLIRQGEAGDNARECPIIALTANALRGDDIECYKAGMSDYMTKPLSPDVLESKILAWRDKEHEQSDIFVDGL